MEAAKREEHPLQINPGWRGVVWGRRLLRWNLSQVLKAKLELPDGRPRREDHSRQRQKSCTAAWEGNRPPCTADSWYYDIARERRSGKQLEKMRWRAVTLVRLGSESTSSRGIRIIVSVCNAGQFHAWVCRKATNPISQWPEEARMGDWESQNDLLNVHWLIIHKLNFKGNCI